MNEWVRPLASGEGAAAPATTTTSAPKPHPALVALCTLARLHQVAADPSTLAHQLGIGLCDGIDTTLVLRAARLLGLKAKLTRTTLDRLSMTPLPVLALMHGDEGPEGQCRRQCSMAAKATTA